MTREASDDDAIRSLVTQYMEWIDVDDLFLTPSDCSDEDIATVPPFKGNLIKLVTKDILHSKVKHWVDNKLNTHVKVLSLDKSDDTDRFKHHASVEDASVEDSIATTVHMSDPPPHIKFSDQTCLPVVVTNRQKVIEGIVSTTTSGGEDEQTDIWKCSQRLLRRLWWWRCTLGKDVTSVLGFVVWASSIHDQICLTILELRMPSSIENGTSTLGMKLHLRVQRTMRATLSNGNTVISFLGRILSTVACDNQEFPASINFVSSGEAMILSSRIREDIQASSSSSLSSSVENPDYSICPTTTGSLVIRCSNRLALKRLLNHYHSAGGGSGDSDSNQSLLLDYDGKNLEEESDHSAWYIKCKTPISFGPFWDTAKAAINGTRARLLMTTKSMSSDKATATMIAAARNKWLYMHPCDAIIESHCHTIIVRGMGHPFRGQLTWVQFTLAFHELVTETLLFQRFTQLVHGDIHENNVLLWEGGASLWSSSSTLVLIDWDEALPKKPCLRLSTSEEERRRYPSALIDFPEVYTKQQFLHLFQHFIQEYYGIPYVTAWKEHVGSDDNLDYEVSKVSVERRFQALLTFLLLYQT